MVWIIVLRSISLSSPFGGEFQQPVKWSSTPEWPVGFCPTANWLNGLQAPANDATVWRIDPWRPEKWPASPEACTCFASKSQAQCRTPSWSHSICAPVLVYRLKPQEALPAFLQGLRLEPEAFADLQPADLERLRRIYRHRRMSQAVDQLLSGWFRHD